MLLCRALLDLAGIDSCATPSAKRARYHCLRATGGKREGLAFCSRSRVPAEAQRLARQSAADSDLQPSRSLQPACRQCRTDFLSREALTAFLATAPVPLAALPGRDPSGAG